MTDFNQFLLERLASDPSTPANVQPEHLQAILHGLAAPYRGAKAILEQGDVLPSQMSINSGAAGLQAASGLFPGVVGAPRASLGAMGGRKPSELRIIPQDPAAQVKDFLTHSEVPFTEKSTRTGSNYIKFYSPYANPEASQKLGVPKPTIRVAPPDEHAGEANLGTVMGTQIDTGTVPNAGQEVIPPSTYNAEGALYGKDKRALTAAMKWLTSTSPGGKYGSPNWLVRPGQEPSSTVPARDYVYNMPGGAKPIEPPYNPHQDPNQLNLPLKMSAAMPAGVSFTDELIKSLDVQNTKPNDPMGGVNQHITHHNWKQNLQELRDKDDRQKMQDQYYKNLGLDPYEMRKQIEQINKVPGYGPYDVPQPWGPFDIPKPTGPYDTDWNKRIIGQNGP